MNTVQWRRLPRHGNAGPGKPFINDGTFVMILALTRSVSSSDAEPLASALTALHVAGDQTVTAIQAAARKLDSIFARVQAKLTDSAVQSRERQILEEILQTGADGEYLDYVSAEQAFMAVQMLAFELKDAAIQAELDALAEVLDNDERYRPTRFAKLLASLEAR
jgi:hypothetical protein